MFDIYSLPLNRRAGQESVRLPGLLVKSAPPKTWRNRREDLLFLFLTLEGDTQLPSSQMEELLNRLASAYFESRGSATTGLRAVAETLNTFLLKRNQAGHSGRQEVGIFNLAVLRKNLLFVAHAGETQSFFLGKTGIQTFYEPFTAGRGLGVGRAIQLSYFQTEISVGDLLILCPRPPESWAAGTLQEIARLPLGQIRRRILEPALTDLQAVVIQFRQGKGRIYQPRLPETRQDTEIEPAVETTTAPAVSGQLSSAALEAEVATPVPPAVSAPASGENEVAGPAEQLPLSTAADAFPADASLPPADKPRQMPPARRTQRSPSKIKEKMADLWVSNKAAQGKLKNRLSAWYARLLPGDPARHYAFSGKTMLTIAIVVPVLVVIIASAVYFATGRQEQREAYLNQAQNVAAGANLTNDPALRANSWLQVLSWLDQAESFGTTPATTQLRQQAEENLDTINAITRLNYYPILATALENDVEITRMAASETDVYLLDSTRGEIHRLIQSGQEYQYTHDTNFKCGPGVVDGVTINPLVDMVVLNKRKFSKPLPLGATILAVDDAGHYLFCLPDLEPIAGQFQIPDAGGWKEVKGIEITEDGRLFVLNPDNNAVWFIDYDQDTENTKVQTVSYTETKPRLLFDEVFPILNNVVDITYFEDALYLLHDSGTITICDPRTFTQPTTCSEMVIDVNQYSAATLPNTNPGPHQYTQLKSNPAPFSSLSILDSQQRVIYQFTSRLKNLNEKFYPKFQPDYPAPSRQPSAFTIISPGNRAILLAYGNQVFKAIP